MSIGAAVLAATGYVGGELLRLVAGHPEFELLAAVSASRSGDPIASVFPHLGPAYGDTAFVSPAGWIDGIDTGAKLALFSAAPHGASAAMVAEALQAAEGRNLDVHVVDSSADFRYPTGDGFEAVYGQPHSMPALLDDFVCALPEHLPATASRHVGHPGCFATAILLAAMPLAHCGVVGDELFVTGITGSTGSGRSPQPGTHHPERHSNLYAYKPLAHRHVPEVEYLLRARCGRDIVVNFVPHSGPFARGIYATVQARLNSSLTNGDLQDRVRTFYEGSEFVRVVEGTPHLKNVVASNYCHIGVAVDNDRVVVMSAIDNLVKGAAGGAMQWMNRLWSLPETAGLTAPAPAWT